MNKRVNTRIQNKHDLEVNWLRASFVPLPGELIIYDREVNAEGNPLVIMVNGEEKLAVPASIASIIENEDIDVSREVPFPYERFKIGDGYTPINKLAFTAISAENVYFNEDITIKQVFEDRIADIYKLLDIDYDKTIAFDIEELVVDFANIKAILGDAILGQMILGRAK